METSKIRCVIMRGGTSKAVFLHEDDIPPEGAVRDQLILRIFGSPDKRQIDGLGGADALTSKLAIIGAPRVEGTDLTYTFGQVEIDHPNIDYKSLCGNISSAVGHYAICEGLVRPQEPVTTVRVFNTNINKILRVEVPVKDGIPIDEGEYSIPGVPGTGAKINLDFSGTAGGATGRLLPTGHPVDILEVEGFGSIEVSLIDIGNAHVFVRARDIGMNGTETPAEIDSNPKLLELLEKVRGAGAARMGMVSAPSQSRQESPATPILGIISPRQSYTSYLNNENIAEEQVDVVSRLIFMQKTHKTYAGTSTACTGIAARIPGTVVYEALEEEAKNRLEVRIGHPAGVIVTESDIRWEGDEYHVLRATLGRTARRILEGYSYAPIDESISLKRDKLVR